MAWQALVVMAAVVAMSVGGFMATAARERPEIEAHRGESHDAPENTMASFKLAWALNDEAAELDVHLTKDGKLIVSHDADTERTAGTKMIIKDATVEELRKLDVGAWKDARFAGARLPLLDEVLATIPEGKRLFIEVKIGPEAVPELFECLKRAKKSPAQTVIIGFNLSTVQAAKKALPALKVYWLAQQKQDKKTKKWTPTVEALIAKAKTAGVDGIDVAAKPTVDRTFVNAVHDAKLECYVWTVDEAEQARALAAAGVDGITTNRAAWLREQLEWIGK